MRSGQITRKVLLVNDIKMRHLGSMQLWRGKPCHNRSWGADSPLPQPATYPHLATKFWEMTKDMGRKQNCPVDDKIRSLDMKLPVENINIRSIKQCFLRGLAEVGGCGKGTTCKQQEQRILFTIEGLVMASAQLLTVVLSITPCAMGPPVFLSSDRRVGWKQRSMRLAAARAVALAVCGA